jgi:preprotein translocase subunit YajC
VCSGCGFGSGAAKFPEQNSQVLRVAVEAHMRSPWPQQGRVALSFSALCTFLVAMPSFGQFGTLPLMLLMFVGVYFLMIVPNQRKQKAWAATLAQVKSGDRVTTSGGIRGIVVTVKDETIILRTQPDGIKMEFVKSAIAAITTEEEIKA